MAVNNIKSIRLNEEIARRIGDGVNFSSLTNQAIKEHLNKSVWIPNFQIEKYANISVKQLWERVENVKFLRYNESALIFTFYPTSKEEINQNRNIHAYVNGEYNSVHDTFVYFNIKFPVNLFLFLRSKQWEQVEKIIHSFLSLKYWLDNEKQHIMERQLEKKTLRSIIKIIGGNEFKKIDQRRKAYIKKQDPKLRAVYNEAYFQLLFDLGLDPIVFPFVGQILSELHHPFHLREHLVNECSNFDIKLPSGYMRDIYEDRDDWRSIIVKGTHKNDDLHRAESSLEPWQNWIENYSFFHNVDIRS